MQRYRSINKLKDLLLSWFLLVIPFPVMALPAGAVDQARVDSMLKQASTLIRDRVIPSLLSVHNSEVKSVINGTEVIVMPGNPFEVYVERSPNGHRIIIGGAYIFLASIQAEAMFWNYAVPEKASEIEEYKKRLLDFVLYGTLIDGHGNKFPTLTQYFRWSPEEAEAFADDKGGIAFYNIYTNLIMFQILTYTLSHEYAHIYLGHTKQDKQKLNLYDRRKNEWHADQEGILAVSRVGFAEPSYIPPMGALLVSSLFSYLEDPQERGTHPSETCRTLYATDALLSFGIGMLKAEKKIGREDVQIAKKERALNAIKEGYKQKKSEYRLSEICDDFVVLRSFN